MEPEQAALGQFAIPSCNGQHVDAIEIPGRPGHAAHETENGGHEIEGEDRALLANASYGWSQRGESGITPRVGTRSRWNRRRR